MTREEHLMQQAAYTAEHYMIEGKACIDRTFGQGFTRNNPMLLAAFMLAAALDLKTMIEHDDANKEE